MKEHPQTAALILSRVKPSCAAKIMTQLPQPLRNNLMRRMLSMKPIVDETMKNIEKTLHDDFMANFSKNAGADTHAKIADIINKMERDHMEDVLSSLSAVRPEIGRDPQRPALHLRRHREAHAHGTVPPSSIRFRRIASFLPSRGRTKSSARSFSPPSRRACAA